VPIACAALRACSTTRSSTDGVTFMISLVNRTAHVRTRTVSMRGSAPATST
jgi:hypothetical protein